MASILVRGLDDSVKQRIAERARNNGRSMEAEVREILTESVVEKNIALALLKLGRRVGGCEELEIPPRTGEAGQVDFG